MRKIIFLLVNSLFMLACERLPPAEMLTSKYFNAQDEYELLKEMIQEDTGVKECFEVGLDHIGDFQETIIGKMRICLGLVLIL